MVLEGTDLDHERLYSKVTFIDDEASKHYVMSGLESNRSWPKFCGGKSRRVNHKLVCFLVKCCCGLETNHVGTVPELRLGIAANDVEVER